MSADGQRTKRRRNIEKNFDRLSRTHERCRQTDDRLQSRRTDDDSERERRSALSLPCDNQVWCSSLFSCIEPTVGFYNSRPNLLHNLPLHSRLQQYHMILFDDGCTQVWVTYPRSLRSDAQPGIKASQMRRPYHSSTTPPQAIAVTVQWGDWTSELQPRGESWQRERRRIINKVQEKAPIEHRNQIRKQASDTHDWGVLVPACRRDLVTSGLICRESQQNLTSVAGQVSFHMNALWIHRLFVYTQRSPLSLYIAT